MSSSTLNYESYLKITDLLGLQSLLSPHHDEMLFILIHQVYELWFKQILHELDALVRLLGEHNPQRAVKVLNRIHSIQKVLLAQIDVLETMTPTEFAAFRDNLRPASGFQSVQFREIEFFSGMKNPQMLSMLTAMPEAMARLEKRLGESTVYDAFLHCLADHGFSIDPVVLNRNTADLYEPHDSVMNTLETIYTHEREHFDLYVLCEALLTYDENMALWRYRHLKMVERTIGFKPGTGGSAGAAYLATTLNKPFFPELWDVRTRIGSY